MASPSSIPPRLSVKTDPSNKPTTPVSLNSPNWVDRLAKANLPTDTVYGAGLGSVATLNVGITPGTVPVYPASGILTSATSAKLLVDAALGNDALAKRSADYPYGTLAKALGDALAGDTIELQGSAPIPLAAGTYALTGKILKGQGTASSVVVPADGVQFKCAGTVQVSGISFDTGKDAVSLPGDNAEGSPVATLFDCAGSANSVFSDLYFHGINGNVFDSGSNGQATQNLTFRNIRLNHVFQGWYMNDGPGSYHRDMLFENILCEWTIARGIGVRGYNGLVAGTVNGVRLKALNRNLRMDNVVARYAGSLNASGPGAAGSLAVEVWHGWSGVYMNKVLAEDSGYGISTAFCDDVHLVQCEARNCNFLLEASDPLDNWMTDCVADSRPSPDSPFVAGGPHGSVYAQNWVGGQLLNTCIRFTNFEINTPVPCLLSNAVIRGYAAGGTAAPIYTQNVGNVTIVNNDVYATIEGVNATPGLFVLLDNSIDLSGATTTITGNRFHGTTNGQVIGYAGNYFTGKLGCLVVTNNGTDSTYTSGVGGYDYSGAILSHIASGNYAVNGGQSLPNDAIASTGYGTFTPEEYGATGDGATDDTPAFQRAADAAKLAGGGRITFSKTYLINGSLSISSDDTVIDGQGCGVLLVGSTSGNVISAVPTTPPVSGNSDTLPRSDGLQRLQFVDFEMQCAPGVVRTSGAAIYMQYALDPLVQGVRIGQFDLDPTHTLPFYDGIYCSRTSNARIYRNRVHMRHTGITLTGDSSRRFFQFGGYFRDNEIWSNFASGSIAAHLGGDASGATISAGEYSTVEIGLLVDQSIEPAPNREVYIDGHAFFDSIGNNGVWIKANSASLLVYNDVWIAGCGRMSSGQPGGPTSGNGLLIESQASSFTATITGGQSYAHNGSGMVFNGVQANVTGVLNTQCAHDGITALGNAVINVSGGACISNLQAGVNVAGAYVAGLSGVNLYSNGSPTTGTPTGRLNGVVLFSVAGCLGAPNTFYDQVTTQGVNGAFHFQDRTSGADWFLYADGGANGTARVLTPTGVSVQITLQGAMLLPVASSVPTPSGGIVLWSGSDNKLHGMGPDGVNHTLW